MTQNGNPPINNKVKQLYDALKADGGDVGTEQEFENWFNAKEENRQKVYEAFKADGADIGKDYDEFAAWLGQGTMSPYNRTAYSFSQEKPAPAMRAPFTSGADVKEVEDEEESRRWYHKPAFTSEGGNAFTQQAGQANRVPFATPDDARKYEAAEEKRHLRQTNQVQVDELSKKIDSALQEVQEKAATESRQRYDNRGLLGNIGYSLSSLEDPSKNTELVHMYDNYPEVRALGAAQRSMREARRIINEADVASRKGDFENWLDGSWAGRRVTDMERGARGAARGLRDKVFDISTWDFGITDLSDMRALQDALEAADNGLALTESQQMLLDAKAVEMATKAYFASDLGHGYKAGSGLGESIPYMLEFVINPAAGVGKSAQAMMVRYALKRFGKEALKKGGKKYIRGQIYKAAGRVVGDVLVAAPAMTATTGAITTAADAVSRMNGEVQFKTDDEGRAVYDAEADRGEESNPWTAYTKAFEAGWISRASEFLGPFNGLMSKGAGKMIGKLADTKGGKWLKFDVVRDYIKKVPTSKWTRDVVELEKKAQYHGMFGEFVEEIYDGVGNALIVGDQKLIGDDGRLLFSKDKNAVFNGESLLETAETVALTSVMFGTAKAVGYRSPKQAIRKAMTEADDAALAAFNGDQMAWGAYRQTIAFGNDAERRKAVLDACSNPQLTEEQKRAVYNYDLMAVQYRGMLDVEAKRKDEMSGVQREAMESFDSGYQMNSDDDRRDAGITYGLRRDELAGFVSEEMLAKIDAELEGATPTGVLGEIEKMAKEGKWTEEEEKKLHEYVQAKAVHDGIEQRINDEADILASRARAQAKMLQHADDQMVRQATLKNNRKVYIISGNIALSADGTVDTEKSDQMAYIYDPVDGKKKPITPDDIKSLDSVESPEDVDADIQKTRQEYIDEKIADANGQMYAKPGYRFESEDGKVIGTVVEADGDNVKVIYNNNPEQPVTLPLSELQRMADAKMMADYMERHPEENDIQRRTENGERTNGEFVEGSPEHYENGMRIKVRNDRGDEKTVTVKRIGRFTITKFIPDENGPVVEFDNDGKPGYTGLDWKVVGWYKPIMAEANTTPQNIHKDNSGTQQEVDQNGQPFIVSSDGTTTFGTIRKDSGLTPGPIKLSEGFNKVDERGNNIGYGRAHIDAGHGQQILSAGFNSIEEFVEYVARNYGEIRISKDRKDNKTYMLLEVQDEKHDATLYIELSRDGSYWNVNSGGIFKKKYTEKKEKVWPSPTVGSDANTDITEVAGSPAEAAEGETADRGGNSSQTSGGKGTNISGTEQENIENNSQTVENELTPEQRPAAVSNVMPMKKVRVKKEVKDENGNPVLNKNGKPKKEWVEEEVEDWYAATPDDAYTYLYDEAVAAGLDEKDADGIVKLMQEQSQKELADVKKKPEPVAGSVMATLQLRKERNAEIEEAQSHVDYWKQVQSLRNRALLERKEAEAAERRAAETAEQKAKREAYEAEQARRQAEAEAAERRRKEENEQRANDTFVAPVQNTEIIEPTEGTKTSATPFEIAKRELADDAEAMEILNSREPQTLEEIASVLLTSGKNQKRIIPEDFYKHTGYGPADAESFSFILSNKGVSISRLGEMVEEGARNENIPFDENDANAGLDAVLAVLGNVRTQGDINNYITNNRIRQAYEHHDEMLSREEDLWIEAHDGLTRADYEGWEHSMEEQAAALNGQKYEDYYNKLAESALYRHDYTGSEKDNGRGPEAGTGTLQGQEGLPTTDTRDGSGGAEGSGSRDESGPAEPAAPTAVAERISAAEAQTDTNPTEGQKKAGNYAKGHLTLDGYNISIEQPKGSIRRGVDADGRAWEQEMHNTYGYIRGTEGVDGDHIDVFLSDDPTQGNVFVIDQVNKDGSFDEHKVMYGFPDAESARAAYLSNYEEGWQGLGTITEVSKDEFKKWVESSHRKTKPFSEYKSVKPEGVQNEQRQPVTTDYQREAEKAVADIAEQLDNGRTAKNDELIQQIADMEADAEQRLEDDTLSDDERARMQAQYDAASKWMDDNVRSQKGMPSAPTAEQKMLTKGLVGWLNGIGIKTHAAVRKGQEMLNKYRELVRALRAYHGSGADFDAFDHSHMGEGEGEQAYGWGTYVTEVEGIGKTYAKAGAGLDAIKYKGMKGGEVYDRADERPEYDAASSVINSILSGKTVDIAIKDAIAFHSQMGENETVKEIRKLSPSDFTISDFGILYTVDIPDDNGSNYLEWDKPVSDEDIAIIRNEMEKVMLAPAKDGIEDKRRYDPELYKGHENDLVEDLKVTIPNGENGGFVYERIVYLLGGEKEASEFLHEMGFTGIKYPAEYMSGGRSDGAKNYVIFNEGDLKIVDKIKLFRDKDGEVIGYTLGGEIYIDPRYAKPETPVHEYTHLIVHAIRANNPQVWERWKELAHSEQDVIDFVKEKYPEYSENEDDFWEEVIANYTGREGGKRLEEEMSRQMRETPDIAEKARIATIFHKLRDLLRRFWDMTKDIFSGSTKGIDNFKSMDDVVDLTLAALANKFDPKAAREEAIRAEEAEIERKAKAAGTWMKAPNGEPSKLTPKQWVQVRTQAFKKWFGDWEKAAKQVKVADATDLHFANNAEFKEYAKNNFQENGKWESYVNKDTGNEIHLSSTGINKSISNNAVEKSKVSRSIHLRALGKLDEILENSILGETHADKNGQANVPEIQRYYGAVVIDGNIYRVKTTVKRVVLNNKEASNRQYSFQVQEMELIEERPANQEIGDAQSVSSPTNSINSISGAKLLKNVESDAKKEKKLLDFSQVVDNNGEPLMVVHHTNNDFTEFDIDKLGTNSGDRGLYGKGFYFSTKGYGGIYGNREMDVYLDIKHPLEIKGSLGDETDIYTDFASQFDKPELRDIVLSDYGKSITIGEYIDAIKAVDDEIAQGLHDERITQDEELQAYKPKDRLGLYREGLIVKRCGFPLITNTSYLIGEQIGSDEFTAALKKAGYDGVIVGKGEGVKEYIAFEPNQIKSATDNIGTFSSANNDIRYQKSGTYTTRDGVQLSMMSLFEEGNLNNNANLNERSSANGDLTELRLRKLEPGETCHVERRYEENKSFSFTGKEKIESMDDVAYIFKQLENAAVENSFIALVKDGKPIIIHTGMGGYASSPVDLRQAFPAYKSINPEQVYFVHNHPSGSLRASREDRLTLNLLREVFGNDVVQDGIIIDTTSGKYGVFGPEIGEGEFGWELGEKNRGEVPMKVYEFSKQVFGKDWKPQTAYTIADAKGIAEFISSHRLGEHPKMSFIIVNNQYQVVGNLFLPWTALSEIEDVKATSTELSNYINLAGGTKGVIYGNYQYSEKDKRMLQQLAAGMNVLRTPLLDVVHIDVNDELGYHSAHDSGVMKPEVEYVTPAREAGESILDYAKRVADDYSAYESIVKALEVANGGVMEAHDDSVSDITPRDRAVARDHYERMVSTRAYQFQEAMQDSMLGLRKLYEAILNEGAKTKGGFRIEEVAGNENAYLFENSMSSRNGAQQRNYYNIWMRPLLKTIHDIVGDDDAQRQELTNYMMAKHGLERNKKFAERDAKKAYEDECDANIRAVNNTKYLYLGELRKKLGDNSIDEETYNKEAEKTRQEIELIKERYIQERDAKIAALEKNPQKDARYRAARDKDYSGLTALTGATKDIDDINEAESKELASLDNRHRSRLVDDEAYKQEKERIKRYAQKERASVVAIAEHKAEKMVAEFEGQHDTKELWERLNDCTKVTLAKLYTGGLISKDVYEQTRDMFKYYIPLRGFDEKTSDQEYGYLTTSKTGPMNSSIMKHAYGRRSKADDPVATIALMADMAIRQANRNEMKQRFLTFAQNHPSDLVSINKLWLEYDAANDEWKPVFADIKPEDTGAEVERKVAEFEEHMKELASKEPDKYKNGSEAANIPYKVMKENLREHQVLVRRNGETYVLTINGSPRAAQALNGLTNPDVDIDAPTVSALIKAGERINRFMSAAYTTRQPDFLISNFFRDTLYSNCMTWVKESPNYALKFHKNFGVANPATMFKLFEKWEAGTLDQSVPIERMFMDFMLNGGETGYTNIKDLKAKKKEVARELARQSSKAKSVANWIGDQADIVNRCVENCARFAAYITSQEMGRSIERSIYDAKEVSVNFNKKGAGDKMAKAVDEKLIGKIGSYMSSGGRLLYIFWNAGMQGMTNFGRAAKRNPKKFIPAAASIFTLGAVIPLLAYGSGDDDDYYNLPEYVRRSNICLPLGKTWKTIPLPVEFRALYGLGELATGVITGKERYSDGELTRQLISQVSQIMPLDFMDGGGLHLDFGFVPSFLTPSFIEPVAQIVGNRDWTGLPIHRERTPWNENNPAWQLAYKSADKYIVGATRWLNEATIDEASLMQSGGNKENLQGWADLNPANIEQLLEGYLGGWFKVPNQLIKMGETALGKRDFEWRNMMIANRLIKEGDERTADRKVKNEYFALLDEYEKVGHNVKEYEKNPNLIDPAERTKFLNSDKGYLHYQIIDAYKPLMDALRQQAKAETNKENAKEIGELENVLRHEIVELVHSYDDQKKDDLEKQDNLGKIERETGDMLKEQFERGGYTRHAAANQIASRLGGKDSYGSGNALKTEYGKIYERKRNYVDLAEDVLLQTAKAEADDDGRSVRHSALNSAQRHITDVKKNLREYNSDGSSAAEWNESVLSAQRELRRKVLEGNQQYTDDEEFKAYVDWLWEDFKRRYYR